MSGALKRSADDILDALDDSVIKMRRAFKDRSETQSEHIRRTTRDNREFDGSHTDSDPGTGPGDHHGPSNGGNSGGSGSDPRLDGLVNDGTIHQRGDGRYQLSSEVRPHKPFAKNDNHSQREFDRQLGMQEAGMRDLTADEFFRNRNGYRARQRNGGSGRTDADLQAAERARLISEGHNGDGQDVLHGPDQVAGGHSDRFDGFGDRGVNRSLGAQWKGRIGRMEDEIVDLTSLIPEELLGRILLNVRLT